MIHRWGWQVMSIQIPKEEDTGVRGIRRLLFLAVSQPRKRTFRSLRGVALGDTTVFRGGYLVLAVPCLPLLPAGCQRGGQLL